MLTIGLFYGTDTGNTEKVSKRIKEVLEIKSKNISVELIEIYKKKKEDMAKYNFLILGMPTWYDGEIQGDWDLFISEMNQIDFSHKKVAFFGLGDQYGYANYFCDAIGIFAEIVEKNSGIICGKTSTEGYVHGFSKAQRGNQFVGLCLDVDHQNELTESRIGNWTEQIVVEFYL